MADNRNINFFMIVLSLIKDKFGKNTKYFIWIIHFFDKNVARKNFFYFFIKKQFFNVSLQPCLKQKKIVVWH